MRRLKGKENDNEEVEDEGHEEGEERSEGRRGKRRSEINRLSSSHPFLVMG